MTTPTRPLSFGSRLVTLGAAVVRFVARLATWIAVLLFLLFVLPDRFAMTVLLLGVLVAAFDLTSWADRRPRPRHRR